MSFRFDQADTAMVRYPQMLTHKLTRTPICQAVPPLCSCPCMGRTGTDIQECELLIRASRMVVAAHHHCSPGGKMKHRLSVTIR